MSLLATILLVVNIFVCIALIAVVLIQRSEGGALGMGGGGGGGPSGFMTTRGAGDLLTRITWILAFIFFGLAMVQTILIGRAHGHSSIVDRLNSQSLDFSTPTQPQTPPAAPAGGGLQAPLPAVQSPPAAVIPGLPQSGGSNGQAGGLSGLAAPPLVAPGQPPQKKP
ncbi:MAG TPA: preprotein translocase subunit SecG [Caulobacteraceae bacterium]|nr:preprotein translocase subunit SecG [Caulobacteraceae bacterium]